MATLVFENTFEEGWDTSSTTVAGDTRFAQTPWQSSPCDIDVNFSLVEDPDDASNQVAKFFQDGDLGCDKDERHRAQVWIEDLNNNLFKFLPHIDYFIGYRVYIPSDFPYVALQTDTEIAHLNATGDRPGELQLRIGGNASGPVFAFNMRYHTINPYAVVFTSENDINMTLGAWNNVIIHWKREWDGTGIFKVWVDDVIKVNETNIITACSPSQDSENPTLKFGVYWGFETRADDYSLLMDDFRIATGDDGYDAVDPGQGDSEPPVISLPDDYTIIDNADGGYAESSAWNSFDAASAYMGNERWEYGEDHDSGSLKTATWTIGALGAAGVISIAQYAIKQLDRSDTIEYKVYEGVAVIASGTLSEKGITNAWTYLPDVEHSTGVLSFEISTANTADFVAADAIGYKTTAAAGGSDIALQAGSFESATGDTSGTISVDVPSTAGAGDMFVVVYGTADDNANNGSITALDADLTEVCTQCASSSYGVHRSHLVAYRFYTGTENATFASTTTQADYKIAAFVLENVDPSTIFDVVEASHSGQGGTYHDHTANDGGVVTSPTITTLTNNAAVITISQAVAAGGWSGPPSSVSSSRVVATNATELFDEITVAPRMTWMFGTIEIVPTAGLVPADVHTYAGLDAGTDSTVLRFALKRANVVSALTFPNSGSWSVSPINVDKNTTYEIDNPIGTVEISGGTPPYSIIGANPANNSCTTIISNNGWNDIVSREPIFGFDGTASYQLTVADSASPANTITSTVSFTVTNTAPVANTQTVVVTKGTTSYPFSIAGWGTDADADELFIELIVDTDTTEGNTVASVDSGSKSITIADSSSVAEEKEGITFRLTDNSNTNSNSTETALTVDVVNVAGTITGDSTLAVTMQDLELDENIDVIADANLVDSASLPLKITLINSLTGTDGADPVATTYGVAQNIGEVVIYNPTAGVTDDGTVIDSFPVTVSNGVNTFVVTLSITVHQKNKYIIETIGVVEDVAGIYYHRVPQFTSAEYTASSGAFTGATWAIDTDTGIITLTVTSGDDPWPCEWVANSPSSSYSGVAVFSLKEHLAKAQVWSRQSAELS